MNAALKPGTLLQLAIILAILLSGFIFILAVPTTRAAAVGVSISGYAFTPGSLSIPVGDTVTWTNNDPVPHTVTADNGAFDQSLSAGSSFSYTFNSAGSFAYHCNFHQYMTGTVTVAAASSSSNTISYSSSSSSTQPPSTTSQLSSTSTSRSSQTTTSVISPPLSSSSSTSSISTSIVSTTSAGSVTRASSQSSTTSPTSGIISTTTPPSQVDQVYHSSTSAPTAENGVPEFPAQALAVAAVAIIVLASYLAVRKIQKTPGA